MEHIKLWDWVIEIDHEKTKLGYTNVSTPAESCGCAYCQNFQLAMPHLPKGFVEALQNIGIPVDKAINVYELMEVEDGWHQYGGWYHLCGKVVSEPEPNEQAEQAIFKQIEDGFHISITKNNSLAVESFPQPIIQLEFTGVLPWLLDRKPE